MRKPEKAPISQDFKNAKQYQDKLKMLGVINSIF